METSVRCPGDGGYTALSPRTALLPAPYAFALPGMRTPRGNNDGLSNPTINVIGGKPNNAISPSSYNSVIAGGDGNVVENNSSTSGIGSGMQNRIDNGSYLSVIAGGTGNLITRQSFLDFIGGGTGNVIGGNSTGGVIGGGGGNVITSNGVSGASGATIPGGFGNLATGYGAFAAGYQASALHNGSFVWGDYSSYVPVSSTAANQFVVRAAGGLRFDGTGVNSASSPAFIHQAAPCGPGPFDGARTAINHPLANGDPNAVLLVTPNYGNGSGAGPVPRNPVAVYYEDSGGGGCPTGRWVIYDVTTSPLPFTDTMRFNVMIIKP
jgi:hypothetical protein